MKIKHRITRKVLYESKKETLKETVIEAISKGAYLVGANLTGAHLFGIKVTEKEKEQIIKELKWEVKQSEE